MWVALGLSLICAWLVVPSRSRRQTGSRHLLAGTGAHWRRNYATRRTFLRLGGALAAAAVLAYSGLDEAVEGIHAGTLRSSATDRLARTVYHGGQRWWFLNWLLVGAVDAWFRTNAFTRWGRKNFEAMVVGLPTLWTLQRGLGANRPSDPDPNPRWRPLADDNAASGHAFIGAVPWLTLAHRLPRPALQAIARVLSVLTGWSRLNDRKHYLSQVILGWTIAYNATVAVDDGVNTEPGEPEETS
ncbi:hypothetical protein DRQ50_06745 [bacterium]|nr:MAG: hypothetical protein DRQ50_06745 [bacterium]